MEKKIIVITGGAGFVGSNLIKRILDVTDFQIISIDNYSSGYINNHIKSNRIYKSGHQRYIKYSKKKCKKNKITISFWRIFENTPKFS